MKSSTRNPVVVGAVLVGILSGLGLLSRFLSYTKKPVPEDSAPPRNRRLSMRRRLQFRLNMGSNRKSGNGNLVPQARRSSGECRTYRDQNRATEKAYRTTAPPPARFDASANSLPVLRSLITNVLFSPSVDHGPRDTSLNSTKRQSVTSVSFNPR